MRRSVGSRAPVVGIGPILYIHICCGITSNTPPKHVWAMDIPYIPTARGFVYLAAVLDAANRRVLSWRVSITLDIVRAAPLVTGIDGKERRIMIERKSGGRR